MKMIRGELLAIGTKVHLNSDEKMNKMRDGMCASITFKGLTSS